MDDVEIDWDNYVKTMAMLHDLTLDDVRHAEVVEQMRRIHILACRFLEFPLDAQVEPAPVFHW